MNSSQQILALVVLAALLAIISFVGASIVLV